MFLRDYIYYRRDVRFVIILHWVFSCTVHPHLGIYRWPVIEGRGFHRRLIFNLHYSASKQCPNPSLNPHNLYSPLFFQITHLLLRISFTGQLYLLPSEIESLRIDPPNHYFKLISARTLPPTHELEVEALAGPDFLNGGAKSSFKLYLTIALDWATPNYAPIPSNTTLSVPVHFRYGLPGESGYITIADVAKIDQATLVARGPGDKCRTLRDSHLLFSMLENATSLPQSVIIPVAIPWHRSFVGYITATAVWFGFGFILHSLIIGTKFTRNQQDFDLAPTD